MSVVKRPGQKSRWYLPGIIQGMGITMKHMISNLFNRKAMITVQYPEERYAYSDRFKGNHILTVKKDGSLRCTACMLCATHCPAECITITAAEHDDPNVEKYPISYEIDILRCVFCGYCEEACPVDAIRMGPEHQTAAQAGSNFIYDITKLAYRPENKGGVLSKVDDEERHKKGL